MLRVDKTTGAVRLTRGDTAMLTVNVSIYQDDEAVSEYQMSNNDTLTLTVKKSTKTSEILLQKVLTGGTTFKLRPDDTRDLPYGKYVYDVQLNMANGDTYTVIDPVSFTILEEVTW